MQQGMNTLEIDRMAPQAQGIETLGSMEEVPMVPEGGIQAAVPDATRMLADAGRHGDIYVVHASEGETVVPKEVLEGPGGQQIRESLFRQMEQMGVDPGRYVVGNELNSVNPETGLPEFFFKKAFKSIKKFFKKAAPIILPIALSFTPLGPILGAAIGSGIGNLIAGGDAKSALKAAAFGGISAGIMSGVGGMMSGAAGQGAGMTGANFSAGITQGLPQSQLGGPGTSLGDRIFGSKPGPIAAADTSLKSPIKATGLTAGGGSPSTTSQSGPLIDVKPAFNAPQTHHIGSTSATAPDVDSAYFRELDEIYGGPRIKAPAPVINAPIAARQQGLPIRARVPRIVGKKPTLTQQVGQYTPFAEQYAYEPLGGGTIYGRGATDAARKELIPQLYNDSVMNYESAFNQEPPAALRAHFYKDAITSANAQFPTSGLSPLTPGYLQQYGGATAALLAAGVPLGWYEKEGGSSTSGRELQRATQEQIAAKRININPPPAREPIVFSNVGTPIPRNQIPTSFPNIFETPPAASAASGGEMQNFPPRIGAISGPGTEKSDDVPAMLSDGEFVMTAQAVRGAGNGSRRQGVENLYNLMRNFEAVA